jgi:hypothetical protein
VENATAGGPPAHLAIVRSITTIDEDGDAAWRVLAASDETHTLRRLLAEWNEMAAAPPAPDEGLGVASPLLFVAVGSRRWVRQQAVRLRREAADLLLRLRVGESDVADEQSWLDRPLRRRGARFTAETWRALALRQLLAGDEPASAGHIEGTVDDRWLFAFYAVPPGEDADEMEGLAGRALEAWFALQDEGRLVGDEP